MTRRPALACALGLCACLVTTLAAQPVVRTADPIKRGFQLSEFPRTVEVADNVYTYEDFHPGAEPFTTTNLIVVTRDGVLVADGQASPEKTRGLVEATAKITAQPIKYVVIGSDHGDHTGGNSAFPSGVKYIVHPNSRATLERQQASPNFKPGSWRLPADAVLVPDRKTLTLGGERIDVIFLGRAHTGGDLAVYLPRLKILYLSEIFLNRVFPAMRSAYPTEWLGALKKAEAMDADVYIPGHGFTERGPVSKEELAAYDRAMHAVIAEATRLYKAGVPVDEAAKQANWGEPGSWTLARSQGPVAVRRVYEELGGKLK